jgi:hypothetical protein
MSAQPTGQTEAQKAREQELFSKMRQVKVWPMSPDAPSMHASSQDNLVAEVQKRHPKASREQILAEAKAWGEAD